MMNIFRKPTIRFGRIAGFLILLVPVCLSQSDRMEPRADESCGGIYISTALPDGTSVPGVFSVEVQINRTQCLLAVMDPVTGIFDMQEPSSASHWDCYR